MNGSGNTLEYVQCVQGVSLKKCAYAKKCNILQQPVGKREFKSLNFIEQCHYKLLD